MRYTHMLAALAVIASFSLVPWRAAQAADQVSLGTDNLAAVKGAHRVIIDQFGVEFATVLKANGAGGGSKASVQAELRGVNDTDMQAFTDRAYRATVESLTQAGFEVVDRAALDARDDYQSLLEKTGKPSPYLVDDTTMESKIFAPSGMKAFFQSSGSPPWCR